MIYYEQRCFHPVKYHSLLLALLDNLIGAHSAPDNNMAPPAEALLCYKLMLSPPVATMGCTRNMYIYRKSMTNPTRGHTGTIRIIYYRCPPRRNCYVWGTPGPVEVKLGTTPACTIIPLVNMSHNMPLQGLTHLFYKR